MSKNKKSKSTGLINFYLPKNKAPVHPYLLCGLFAPTSPNTKNKKGYLESNDEIWRYYKHSDSFSVKVNRNFLEMKNDFLVFAYLLMRLEKTNQYESRDQLRDYIYVSYAELTEFFNFSVTTKRARKRVIDAVERFIGTKLVIKFKKSKDEVEITIPNLVCQIDEDKKKERYKIVFPQALFKLYFEVNRVALIDFDKFKKLESEFARKLYVYFRALTVPVHTYETLKKVLGHHIVTSDDKNTFMNVVRNSPDNKFSYNLNQAFIELYDQNVISNHPKEFKKQKDAYQIRFVDENKKDLLTEKEKDELQEEDAQIDKAFDSTAQDTQQADGEQYLKEQERLLNWIDSTHPLRGVDWKDP